MGDESNRRIHPRAAIELKVEYKKLNTFFQDYTRNICKGGTFINTYKPLSVGTEFLFQLIVPELPEPLTLKGVVRWIVIEEDAGKDPTRPDPGMGIQFIYDSDDERDKVESIVEQLMKKHLGDRAYDMLVRQARNA
jgi:type IV pilus assembly protein PilZ